MPRAKQYWLMKSEPNAYSIDDLAKDKNKTTCWDGVRNYQARNMMRDEMKKGDLVLFYHSNAKPPCVAGVAKVVKESYPDHTAQDPKSKYHDPKATEDNPRWFMVDIQLVKKFKRCIPLDELKEIKALKDMRLLQKGSRLSVQPVSKKEYETILKLGG
ncbi:MAG: EVE domain-containing protein [Pirellulaceae bacterium]